MKMELLAIGEILIDFATTGTNEEGYPVLSANPGGAPANFLAAAAAYGITAGMMGKVGKDAFGDLLIRTLREKEIDTKGVISDGSVFTTLAFVTFDSRGDRSFSFARKPGADICLSEKEIDYEMIDDCKVLHFGTVSMTDEPSRTATKAAVSYAKEKKKMISYDPNYRAPLWAASEEAKDEMLWGLENADIIKISDDEVNFLFGMQPQDGAEYIFDRYKPKLLYVTCGSKGSIFIGENGRGSMPALDGIKVMDTTGAGDIFGGSAMSMFLKKGKSPEELSCGELKEIVEFATVAAGISTTRLGGISSIPSEEDIKLFLQRKK